MYSRVKNILLAGVWLACFGLSFSCQAADVNPDTSAKSNKLQNVTLDDAGVVFETVAPIDGEYAVYDSVDPLRIVVDFSGVAIDDVSFPDQTPGHPYINAVRSSSFDLSSGQMGRIELFLIP